MWLRIFKALFIIVAGIYFIKKRRKKLTEEELNKLRELQKKL